MEQEYRILSRTRQNRLLTIVRRDPSGHSFESGLRPTDKQPNASLPDRLSYLLEVGRCPSQSISTSQLAVHPGHIRGPYQRHKDTLGSLEPVFPMLLDHPQVTGFMERLSVKTAIHRLTLSSWRLNPLRDPEWGPKRCHYCHWRNDCRGV
jgi:hypothetical protein